MNLGRHDKGFLLGRMIGKINNEVGGRENKLEIKTTKYLERPVKWQWLFSGQKYIMKREKKNPIIQTSIIKLRQISVLTTSPGNQGKQTHFKRLGKHWNNESREIIMFWRAKRSEVFWEVRKVRKWRHGKETTPAHSRIRNMYRMFLCRESMEYEGNWL